MLRIHTYQARPGGGLSVVKKGAHTFRFKGTIIQEKQEQCRNEKRNNIKNLKLANLKANYYEIVRYHCGGWSEEVNSCILILSYMVYL